MTRPRNNTILYARSIPKTMPMLPSDPRKARIDIIITYQGHKQSRGIELHLPQEEVLAILARMDRFLVEEANFYNTKAEIDRHAASL